MRRNRKKRISGFLICSLLISLFSQFAPLKLVSAADAAVQVELQQIVRPNEVETGVSAGLGELVTQEISTKDKTLVQYSKFSVEERGWVWIDNTVNTTYPGNASSSTLYANASLTKEIAPTYKVHDVLGERLYAYYIDRGTYYLETELYSYFMGVDLPLRQAVYGYYLPASQAISVEVEAKPYTALLHCTSTMSDVVYYWTRDISTVDVMSSNSNFHNFYTNKSLISDIEVDMNGDYSVCAFPNSQEWEHYPIDLHVMVEGVATPKPQETDTPIPSETNSPIPSETNSPVPSETDTPIPSETDTPIPSETNSPIPSETNSPVPSVPPDNTAQPSTEPPIPSGTNTDSQQDTSSSVTDVVKKKTLIQKPGGRVSIKKLKKNGKGGAIISWGKVKCNSGYQIQYSLKRNFSKKKTTTSLSTTKYIWGKSNKTYYVRVRAVNWGWISQTQFGYKYGKWSKVKKVRMK